MRGILSFPLRRASRGAVGAVSGLFDLASVLWDEARPGFGGIVKWAQKLYVRFRTIERIDDGGRVETGTLE